MREREGGLSGHGRARVSGPATGPADGATLEQMESTRLVLRKAMPSDLAPLEFFFDTALRRDYFVRRGQLADLLKSERHEVYVAEIDLVLVGVAITTRGARLVNALVHPAYRGLGIGRELVGASGAREVRAKVDMSTGDPRGFYRSLGFAATGERNRKGNIELMARLDEPVRETGGRTQSRRKRGGI